MPRRAASGRGSAGIATERQKERRQDGREEGGEWQRECGHCDKAAEWAQAERGGRRGRKTIGDSESHSIYGKAGI